MDGLMFGIIIIDKIRSHILIKSVILHLLALKLMHNLIHCTTPVN